MSITFFKFLVVGLLAIIVFSLCSGLYFLIKEKDGKTNKMVTSLSFRVFLSLTLFALLFYGFYSGLIQPHGI